ncbi:MAG TPA: threonine synthase [Burkholderiales bacterium]
MRYVSTRGGGAPQPFCDILLEGLAADGGLFLPESVPQADLAAWRKLSYPALAEAVLAPFIDDLPRAVLKDLVARSYTQAAFGSADIAPLKTLEPGLFLLGLSNGPTLAFKDMAMQLLGNLFEQVLTSRGETLNILGATSGDTGSAAEHALAGKKGIQVFMLSPHGRMSPFQRAQMFSLDAPNIHNLAVKGVFDDCQDVVKKVNSDAAFKAKHHIGAVNSINWARVAAQVVYYFWGYFRATKTDAEAVSFAVPSGNFGNIYAGWVARSMGLPVKRFVLATNENDVLDEFFRTGRYRVRGGAEVSATSSPSMDISKASNFERFIFEMVGRDGAKVRALWAELDAKGMFNLSGTEAWERVRASGFVSGRSTHADRLATIREAERRWGVLIDPHTADGVKIGLEHREPGVPLVCLETALPVKFAETIREATGEDPPRPAGFEGLEAKPQRFEVIEADAEAVKRFVAAHAG